MIVLWEKGQRFHSKEWRWVRRRRGTAPGPAAPATCAKDTAQIYCNATGELPKIASDGDYRTVLLQLYLCIRMMSRRLLYMKFGLNEPGTRASPGPLTRITRLIRTVTSVYCSVFPIIMKAISGGRRAVTPRPVHTRASACPLNDMYCGLSSTRHGYGVACGMFSSQIQYSYLMLIYKLLTPLCRACANQHGRLSLPALLSTGGDYNGCWLAALCPCLRHL